MMRKKGAGRPKGLPGAQGDLARRAPLSAAAADPTLARVRELAQIATEFDLAEIELEPAGRLRVVRKVAGSGGHSGGHAGGSVGGGHAVHAPGLSHPPLSVVSTPVEAEAEGIFVSSPFVGTFYRAPSPEAPAFVELGQSVRKGQVVCIIEAMKLMNEIESEADGKVAEVLVKNGEHVEYGQKLFRLTKA